MSEYPYIREELIAVHVDQFFKSIDSSSSFEKVFTDVVWCNETVPLTRKNRILALCRSSAEMKLEHQLMISRCNTYGIRSMNTSFTRIALIRDKIKLKTTRLVTRSFRELYMQHPEFLRSHTFKPARAGEMALALSLTVGELHAAWMRISVLIDAVTERLRIMKVLASGLEALKTVEKYESDTDEEIERFVFQTEKAVQRADMA